MKVRLGPQAEIDTLTKDELIEVLEDFIGRTVIPDEEQSRDFATFSLTAGGNTSGAQGTVEIPVFTVKTGYKFRPHMLAIMADGFSAGVPASATGITVKAGGRLCGVQANAPIPGVFTWGSKEAPTLVGGEVLTIQIEGGPANGVLSVFAEGYLKRYGL